MTALLQRGAFLCSILCLCWLSSVVLAQESKPAERFSGPWNLSVLKQTPRATWGAKNGLLQEVYYEGEPLAGKPTRIFAYVARPEHAAGPVPGIVLVHGGLGSAYPEWATLWAKRGYMAIAMDLSGCGPDKKRLPDGAPTLDNPSIFHDFTAATAKDTWSYHAVAAVLRGHSLLASCEGVDPNRIGITGISWGGYLTCIAAGIDDRFKAAAPVYGCGFLYEDSCWWEWFATMDPEARKLWISLFDPSKYLPARTARCCSSMAPMILPFSWIAIKSRTAWFQARSRCESS